MRKDFADKVSSQATSRRSVRRRATSRPSLKRFIPRKWFAGLSFRQSAKGLLALVASLLLLWVVAGSGESGVASTSITQEEWIDAEAVEEANVESVWSRELIRRGDAAAPVLMRMGYSRSEAYDILKIAKPVYSLAQVRAGRYFTQRRSKAGTELYYPVDYDRVLYMGMRDKTWKAEMRPRVAFSRTTVFEGEISDSLFSDAARVGMDERTTMNLVDIFAWDIDFVRDLRNGDHFRVLTEDRFDVEGRHIGSMIRAAEFVNQGQSYRAIRYTLADGSTGYYTPEGKSMRKTYLKAPVKFSRISSRFQLRRKHPVLGFTRAHRGVDYAAASGTPIHAVGEGRVDFSGWKGGYGRFVLIRHLNSTHSTAYGHMRRYAKGIRKGARVRQGQVIGYVGMSGLATGPHLHFEFRVHGRALNPLNIKREPAKPVPAAQMASFRMEAEQRLQAMLAGAAKLAWG